MELKYWACPAKASRDKEGEIQLSPAAALPAVCPTASPNRLQTQIRWEERRQFKHSAWITWYNSGSGKHMPRSWADFSSSPQGTTSLCWCQQVFLFFSHEFAYVRSLIQGVRGRKTQQTELALVSSPLLPVLGLLLLLTQNNSIGLLWWLPNNPDRCQPHLREHQPHGWPRGWKENQRSC